MQRLTVCGCYQGTGQGIHSASDSLRERNNCFTFASAAVRLLRVRSSKEQDSRMTLSIIRFTMLPAASRDSTRPGTAVTCGSIGLDSIVVAEVPQLVVPKNPPKAWNILLQGSVRSEKLPLGLRQAYPFSSICFCVELSPLQV